MSKPVTLKDIAREAGVGVITCSRALRGIGHVKAETREKILRVADRLGYNRSKGVFKSAPARMGSVEHKLRLVLPAFMGDMDRISGRFGAGIMKGLEQRLAESGGELYVLPVERPSDITEKWPKKKIHGVVLRHILPAAWIDSLKRYAPVVYSVAQDSNLGVDSVNYDEDKAATSIVQHLLKKGHRQIVCMGFFYHRPTTHLPLNLFNDRDPRDRQARLFYGRRMGAWYTMSEMMKGLIDINLEFLGSHDQEVSVAELSSKAVRLIERKYPSATAVILLTGSTESFIRAASERKINIPTDLSLLSYQSEKGDRFSGLDVSGVRLPTLEVGKAVPEIIERRLAFPDARAVSLNFECSWHAGKTLAKME